MPMSGEEWLEPAVQRIQRGADDGLPDVLPHRSGAGQPFAPGPAEHGERDDNGPVPAGRSDLDVLELEPGRNGEQLFHRPQCREGNGTLYAALRCGPGGLASSDAAVV